MPVEILRRIRPAQNTTACPLTVAHGIPLCSGCGQYLPAPLPPGEGRIFAKRNYNQREVETMYTCTITSNSDYGRTYEVATASAIKCAEMFGRCEGGEVITVRRKSGRILSRAIYNIETRSYMRVNW